MNKKNFVVEMLQFTAAYSLYSELRFQATWIGVHGMSVCTVQRAHAVCAEQSLQGRSKIPHSQILPETPWMYCTSNCELIWWLHILKPFTVADICRTPTFSHDGHHDPSFQTLEHGT